MSAKDGKAPRTPGGHSPSTPEEASRRAAAGRQNRRHRLTVLIAGTGAVILVATTAAVSTGSVTTGPPAQAAPEPPAASTARTPEAPSSLHHIGTEQASVPATLVAVARAPFQEDEPLPPAADNAVLDFIQQSASIASPQKTLRPVPGFSETALGSALGELEAQRTEFASNKWSQTGTVTQVGNPKVSHSSGDDKRLSVTICLDSSSIEIADADGAIVHAGSPPGTRTLLNTYVLEQDKDQWLVVEHTFPENPAC